MNARNMKINGLIKQRNYISEHMKEASRERDDGDPTVIYSGTVYPENVRYFSEIGWNMTRYDSEEIISQNNGYPQNIFEPKEDIILSESELELSLQLAENTESEIEGNGLSQIFMLLEEYGFVPPQKQDDDFDIDAMFDEIKKRSEEEE